MLKLFWLILFLGFMNGCASFEQRLADDVVASSTIKLNRCEIEGFDYSGINQNLGKNKILKVMMIHGVGTHHPGYSRLLQENLANNLGLDVISRKAKNVTLKDPKMPNTNIGNLQVTFWQNRDASKNMLFYELTWSEITTPYKKIIAFDTTEQYSEFRVPFNNMMKEFLDNVLPDPLIYLVDRHDLILNSNQQALCWMLKSNWDTIPNGKSEVCTISTTEEIKALAEQNVMFITHSLGSKILMDTVTAMAYNISDFKSRQAMKKLQNKEMTIFMLANQLPILQLDHPLPKVYNQISNYCEPSGKKYNERIFKAVNIVAFSDPNDILSYAIPQGFADKYIDSRICPMVTNVSVNVAPEISAFGIGIVNPVEAHTYYDRSNKVINLITAGTDEFSKDRVLENQCHFVKMRDDNKIKP